MIFKAFLLAICSLYTNVDTTSRCVEILDAGLLPVIKDHIGINFFVTVMNRGPDTTEVEVSMVQCCEDFPGGQSECAHFHLIPETRVMEADTVRNYTLTHPTLYPYDRRGECLLAVRYMTSCNRSKEARQHITFDTSLNEENVKCNIIRGYSGHTMDEPLCSSVDEDPLDHCKMVDCHKKYFGLKSYFNKGSRLCEPVPACISSKRRAAPTTVYDVTTNQCSDLGCLLSEDDLQHLSHADLEPECRPYYPGKMSYVNCHHGDLSNVTGDCECEDGYRPAAMPEDPGSPRTQLIHSCNVDNRCWSWNRFLSLPDRSVFIIALVLALLVAVMTTCIVQYYTF